jgi:lipoate-protein ligase A
MICIYLKSKDPFFCLAAEEYLLKCYSENIFMVWQCENTVVVGKHQNAMAEINYRFIKENNILVARRISGGGTVFHDSGNVNFTFIRNVLNPSEISFAQFTKPIVDALALLGIKATTSGRNDLLINGKKISGNAEHVYKNRVLHHGTLLFNSDLKNLGQAIKVTPGKYQGKAVHSNRSEVTNIIGFLTEKIAVNDFISFIVNTQLESSNNIYCELSDTEKTQIEKAATEKFRLWDWNFGYSPGYIFKNEAIFDDKNIKIEFEVEKGIIQNAVISGNFYSNESNHTLSLKLKNAKHEFNNIEKILSGFDSILNSNLLWSFF